MTEVLEVTFADFHAGVVGLLFDAPHTLLLHYFALFLMQTPVLGTVLACAVTSELTVTAYENRLSVADLAGLHNDYIQMDRLIVVEYTHDYLEVQT